MGLTEQYAHLVELPSSGWFVPSWQPCPLRAVVSCTIFHTWKWCFNTSWSFMASQFSVYSPSNETISSTIVMLTAEHCLACLLVNSYSLK